MNEQAKFEEATGSIPNKKSNATKFLELLAAAIFVFHICFLYLLVFILGLLIIWLPNKATRVVLSLFLVAYLIFIWLDLRKPMKSRSTRWPTIVNCVLPLVRLFKNYFPISHKLTPGAERTFKSLKHHPRPLVLGCHPHGLLSVGIVTNMLFDNSWLLDRYPHLDLRLLTLYVNFLVAFWREWSKWLGVGPVNRSYCEMVLNSSGTGGKSTGVIIVVGGAREALDCNPGKLDLTLKCRTGMFYLALKYGALLVPILNFGENDLWTQIEHPILRRVQLGIMNIMGISWPIIGVKGFWGVLFGWIPARTPVTTVIGEPIDVGTPKETITPADIDDLRNKYIKGLQSLYLNYKGSCEVVSVPKGLRIVG